MAWVDYDFFLWFVRVSTWPWPCPYVVGDLAFQVQFGQFSEEQRDRIMEVLTAMFCYKHSKVQQLYCKLRWSAGIIQMLINEKFIACEAGVKQGRGRGNGRRLRKGKKRYSVRASPPPLLLLSRTPRRIPVSPSPFNACHAFADYEKSAKLLLVMK